jgi:lipopolysaccharide heptosyltransferase I
MRRHPPRILVVRLSALGDVIHALPVLTVLREAHPDARIDWVVEDRAADLLAGRPELDRVVVFPRRELAALRRRPAARVRRAFAFVLELREHGYDASLDLQGNLKSGVIARLSGARQRFGLDRSLAREGNHLFTTLRIRPPRDATHRVQRNLALAGRMVGREAAWSDPGLPPSPAAAARARDLLAEAGVGEGVPYVVLHPGTSAFGAFKRWPPERFADLAATLAGRGTRVVVTAPPGEETLAREVAARSGDAAVVVRTRGLDVLGEVIRGATHFVGADTGPLHLAALGGTPVVGLFGPKDPAIYGPWGRRGDGRSGRLCVLGRADVACRPCGLRSCADPVCMSGLDAEAVLRALDP